MRKLTENQEKNTKKKERRKNPKRESVKSISIILHLVMTVQTTLLIQRLNMVKVITRREAVPTGIMTFHFLSMAIYQEAM